MKFEIITRKFEIEDGVIEKLYKKLRPLERPLKRYQHYERKGDIIIEHRPKRHEFEARIHFHLPKHEIATNANGHTASEALQRAASEAREKVLKIKELSHSWC